MMMLIGIRVLELGTGRFSLPLCLSPFLEDACGRRNFGLFYGGWEGSRLAYYFCGSERVLYDDVLTVEISPMDLTRLDREDIYLNFPSTLE